MMSKIKSSKIARIKLIGGLVLAAALIAVFSLENKVKASILFPVSETEIQSAVTTESALQSSDTTAIQTIEKESGEKPRIELISMVSTTEKSESPAMGVRASAVKAAKDSVVAKAASPTAGKQGERNKRIVMVFAKGTGSLNVDDATFQSMKASLKSDPDKVIISETDTEFVVRDKTVTEAVAKERLDQSKKSTGKAQTTIDGKPVFFIVDDMPEFPGGEYALRDFIAHEVKYPVEAQKAKIEGKVYVNFIVDKDGKVRNAKIARGVDPSLDAEALRVVSALPVWTPGKQKGEPVAVSYTVPIKFSLQ